MRRALAGTALTAALIGLTAINAQAATPNWRVTQTDHFPEDSVIYSIEVTPTGGAWAGGNVDVNGHPHSLIQHLTSTGWKTIPSPSGSAFNDSGGVVASSNENVWMFGGANLAARWDGKRWTKSTMTSGFSADGIVVLSPSNVWAVGGNAYRYADHWNGKHWTKVTLAAAARKIPGTANALWTTGRNGQQPTVMHWGAAGWKVVKTPAFALPDPNAYGVFHDIDVISAKNIWAVGGFEWQCGEPGHDSCNFPITLHWNGHAWTKTIAAEGVTSYDQVTSDGAGGVWMLQGSTSPLLVHDVNGRLTSRPAPQPAGNDVYLDVLANRGRTVWAAGSTPDPPFPTTTSSAVYLRYG
jgi:hypothetical protein